MIYLNYTWNKENYQKYLKYLKSLSEVKYQEFSSKLTKSKYELLGIRVPTLRKMAKEISKGDWETFLELGEDKYLEEVLIQGLVIAWIKEESVFDQYFYKYIKKIDNWEINDIFSNSLKIMKKNPAKYFNICEKLTKEREEFTIRIGLTCILNHFVLEKYLLRIYEILDNLESKFYYVNMAAGWLLCECYIKYPQKTKEYLKVSKLNKDAFNKGIQKMLDSYRVSKIEKEELRKLKGEVLR